MGDRKKFARPEMADAIGARTSGCERLRCSRDFRTGSCALLKRTRNKAILHGETEAFQFLASVCATTKGRWAARLLRNTVVTYRNPNVYENPNRGCGDRDSSGVGFAFDWS